MSHVTTIDCEENYDVKSLKQMCRDMDWEFLEGKTTYKWWGSHVGDYPVPEGFRVEDMGKCQHAIKIPGASYEIGFTTDRNGKLRLLWDFYSTGGLQRKLGEKAGKLKQAYRIAKVKTTARSKGFQFWTKPEKNGWKKIYIKI